MAPPASHHFIQDTDHLQVSRQTRLTSICLLLILQDEIRKLERDLNTLSYKSSSMSASYQRDRTEVEEFRRETLMIEAEVREWMGRDARAASSVLRMTPPQPTTPTWWQTAPGSTTTSWQPRTAEDLAALAATHMSSPTSRRRTSRSWWRPPCINPCTLSNSL